MPLAIALLLGLAGILVIAQPLLGLNGNDRDAASQHVPQTRDSEEAAKAALREIELDYRLGTLQQADYAALRARYEQRALAAIRMRYDREQSLDTQIDTALAVRRGLAAKTTTEFHDKHTASSHTSSGASRMHPDTRKSTTRGER